jgi:WD40 repeat protein
MGHVWAITYSPDGTRVITGSRDATVRILDARSGAAVRPPLTGHRADAFCTVFAPDGDTLASSRKGGTIRFWDGRTGEASRELAARYDGSETRRSRESSDGERRNGAQPLASEATST